MLQYGVTSMRAIGARTGLYVLCSNAGDVSCHSNETMKQFYHSRDEGVKWNLSWAMSTLGHEEAQET